MIIVSTPKDPDDSDDFLLDWTNVLGASETISTFTATVVSGDATVSASIISGASTIARIAGGTNGTKAQVRYRIVTSSGRQLDRTLQITIATQ